MGTYVMALSPDHPLRFTFVSDRWLRMLQLERQAVLADPSLVFQRIHPDDRAPFTALHEQVVAEARPLFWEGRLSVHGVTSWVRIESIPRPNPAGGTIWEGVMVDITSQQQARQELERERALLHTVLSQIDAYVYMKDRQGRYLYANSCAQRALTGGIADVRGRRDADFLPAEVAAAIRQVDEQVLRLGVPRLCEETIPDRLGGGERVFLSQKLPYRQPGQPDGLIGFSTDITELRRAYQQLAESEEHYRLLSQNMSDVVFLLDAEGRILWVSPSLIAALGWQPEEWIGRLGIDFLPQHGESEAFRQNVARLLAGESGVRARDEVFARDGAIHWVETQADPYRNDRGEIEGIVSSFRLIDQQVATEKQLQHLATTDGLTGIANRRHLDLLVNQELERVARYGETTSLILCDIDNFKAINDVHGHHIGDQVLVDFSRRILRQVRQCDTFGRWGGEEFLLLLPATRRDAALALAQHLCQAIATSRFPPVGTVTASFGVAEHLPRESQVAWLQRLDAALYAAKAAGRNGVHAA